MEHLSFLLALAMTLGQAEAQAPSLYFSVNGTTYLPGDTVLITDIGALTSATLEGAANALLCHTEHINLHCCRARENPSSSTRVLNEWLFPGNIGMVPNNHGNTHLNWTRSGFTHQVRLNRRYDALTPTGDYTCIVQDAENSTLTVRETITLILATVSIPSALSVSEESGAVLVCATLAITPTAATTSRDVSVSLATSDDSALESADYTGVSIDLTFSAGSGNGSVQCININITADGYALEPEEVFYVTLFTPLPCDNNSTTVTITDSDVATVSVPEMVSVGEADETATMCATLSGVAVTIRDLIVKIAADDDGTAMANATITFPEGSKHGDMRCISVQISPNNSFIRLTTNDSGVRLGNNITTVVTKDVDECSTGTDNCDPNATCTNTEGSFTCACNQGYSGDGHSCTDIDECASSDANNCDFNAWCINTVGSFTCACNQGYSGDGHSCTDINECASSDANNCDFNARCINTVGSFTCACNQGYSGDGHSCTNIDECASSDANNCDFNARCINTVGSFTCACNQGYSGDGHSCTNIDECASSDANNCDFNARCINTVGSFTCACNQGYSGDGITCTTFLRARRTTPASISANALAAIAIAAIIVITVTMLYVWHKHSAAQIIKSRPPEQIVALNPLAVDNASGNEYEIVVRHHDSAGMASTSDAVIGPVTSKEKKDVIGGITISDGDKTMTKSSATTYSA